MVSGWLLVKPQFHDSYETNRLVEEFKNHDVSVRIINPTEIDIFVNKDNKSSILVNGESLSLPKFVFPRTGSGTTYYIKAVIRHFERMGVVVINGSDSPLTNIDCLFSLLTNISISFGSIILTPTSLFLNSSTNLLVS